jgi:predicted phage-related endonuclease
MGLTNHQLELRKNHLGASETPVILGLSPFSMTPRDIYWRKVADIEDEPTKAQARGHWLEDSLLDWAAEQLGTGIVRNQFRVLHEGEGAEILSATHDALMQAKPEGLEAKVVGRWNPEYVDWGEEGTDQIPASIVIQCQQQMLVSGLEVVWLPVAIEASGMERRMYRVPRDEELIGLFRVPAVEWWRKYVLSRIVPGDDPTPPMAVLKRLQRIEGSVVDLEAAVAELVESREQVKAELKAVEERDEALKCRIIEALGEAEAGRLPDGRLVTYKEQRSSPSADLATLKLRAPELYAEIVHQGTHRTLRVCKAKKSA